MFEGPPLSQNKKALLKIIAERTESARGDHNRETHATLLALLRALSNGSQEGVA
jgi:hypothetical protein